MKEHWLKERLIKAKQDSNLWGAFADSLQEMWDELVDPVLTRISSRKSFFTMSSEDMDTRIAEYGRFFVITDKDKSRRPMLLTQRLDEIHFKGTYQPIDQTFWREFGEMPVKWEPLFAPVDIERTPYGTFLATAREVTSALSTYGSFFQTSRGRVVLDLNLMYEIYGTEGRDAAVRNVQEHFANIIAPLIPLHIVFDGLTLQLIVAAYEKWDAIYQRRIDVVVDAGFRAEEIPERIGENVETSISSATQYIVSSLPRSLEPIPICFDTMPLDGWMLGVLNIIPPVMPGGREIDLRLYEKKTEVNSTYLMLKTLGQFGCLVEYTDGSLARYGFPSLVSDVVLQPTAGQWRKTIRKISYLHSIDEVRYNVLISAKTDSLSAAVYAEEAIRMAEKSQNDKLVVSPPNVQTVHDQGFKGIPRSLNTIAMNYDEVPLDQWLTDQVSIIPPIMPGNNENDPRIFEQDSCLMLKTLGQGGCLVEYTDGSLIHYLFPANSESVILQKPAGKWRTTIRKISYLAHS